MSTTRAQDFREIRRLLGDPMENRPTPDIIVSNQIAAEQFLMNRATGTGNAWTHNSLDVESVIDQAEYSAVPDASPVSFGKALFVYRALDDGLILPIPYTDFRSEFQDQRYQFWIADPSSAPREVSAEKIAFFRDGNTVKFRLYPIPTEVKTYTIVYASGALDWDQFAWTDEPIFPEYSRLRQLHAALASLAKCQWDGLDFGQNAAYRNELRQDLRAEYAMQDAEFTPFLRNPQHEPSISEVGYYWE